MWRKNNYSKDFMYTLLHKCSILSELLNRSEYKFRLQGKPSIPQSLNIYCSTFLPLPPHHPAVPSHCLAASFNTVYPPLRSPPLSQHKLEHWTVSDDVCRLKSTHQRNVSLLACSIGTAAQPTASQKIFPRFQHGKLPPHCSWSLNACRTNTCQLPHSLTMYFSPSSPCRTSDSLTVVLPCQVSSPTPFFTELSTETFSRSNGRLSPVVFFCLPPPFLITSRVW
jgi:hypothetical protein